jgi:predicted Zn-dependent protease
MRSLCVLATLGLVGAGCATNPVTGQRQLALMTVQQEIELGRQAHQETLASIGAYPDAELQAYVSQIGLRLAADSERPELPWTFTVLDDPTVNAFALPGGFIYLTRGILSHMTSEAEMVSVLGHEIGHVTARHGVERMSKAQLAQIGLIAGAVLAPEEFGNYGGVAQLGLQALFLHYSRDDERQADDLGYRYMNRANYDPNEMIGMFQMLGRVTTSAGGGRLPSWLATHPDPANRGARVAAAIGASPPDLLGVEIVREPFLGRLNQMMFGDNPREGYFVGSTFYHPDLAFSVQFPDGWKFDNQKASLSALSPNQDAVLVLSLAQGRNPAEAAQKFFTSEGIQLDQPQRGSIGGLPASGGTFVVNRGQGQEPLAGEVAFVQDGQQIFQILGYTLSGRYGTYGRFFERTLRSFGKVRDRRYLDVSPKRIELVPVRENLTVAEFDRRWPSTVDLATLAIVNGLGDGETLKAGQTYKRIVGGVLPER